MAREKNFYQEHKGNHLEMTLLKRSLGTPVFMLALSGFFTGSGVTLIVMDETKNWIDIGFLILLPITWLALTWSTLKLMQSSVDMAESSGALDTMRMVRDNMFNEFKDEVNKKKETK